MTMVELLQDNPLNHLGKSKVQQSFRICSLSCVNLPPLYHVKGTTSKTQNKKKQKQQPPPDCRKIILVINNLSFQRYRDCPRVNLIYPVIKVSTRASPPSCSLSNHRNDSAITEPACVY